MREELKDIRENHHTLMSEMLHNIKMLKLYGWDLWFVGRIRDSKDNLDTKEKQLANRDHMIG